MMPLDVLHWLLDTDNAMWLTAPALLVIGKTLDLGPGEWLRRWDAWWEDKQEVEEAYRKHATRTRAAALKAQLEQLEPTTPNTGKENDRGTA